MRPRLKTTKNSFHDACKYVTCSMRIVLAFSRNTRIGSFSRLLRCTATLFVRQTAALESHGVATSHAVKTVPQGHEMAVFVLPLHKFRHVHVLECEIGRQNLCLHTALSLRFASVYKYHRHSSWNESVSRGTRFDVNQKLGRILDLQLVARYAHILDTAEI